MNRHCIDSVKHESNQRMVINFKQTNNGPINTHITHILHFQDGWNFKVRDLLQVSDG
jgi:hypothetical protein